MVAWALLAGCAVVGGWSELYLQPVSPWTKYVLAGCLVALLLIVPARDLLAAWRAAGKR